MELRKEEQLEQTYKDYLELMMYDLPIERINDLVDDDVKGFGSTMDEKFLGMDRIRKMVIDQREQAAGIDINWEKTAIHKRISPDEDTAIYTDEFLLTMQMEKGKHIIPLRLSSIFEFNKAAWKLVHIHGSTGADTEEDDTWHMEEWKKKNEELQQLVEEKTADLERKNRELELEAALERVRSRTMAMQKSNELAEAASLLFQQVKLLGIETYTSGFNIWDEEKQQLISWMSNPSGVLNPPFIMPITEYNQHARFFKAWKNHDLFIEDDIRGERMVQHYQYLRSFPLMDQAFAKSEKVGIKTPDRQVHNVVFFSHGYLLFITLEPHPQFHDVFKRFGQVFEQTYTRFLDLQKAEAQARESQIQLALERVRARTMTMHNSVELAETAGVLFQQFVSLGINPKRCFIGIIDKDKKSAEFYLTSSEGKVVPGSDLVPMMEQENLKGIFAAWENKKEHHYFKLQGQKRVEWTSYIMNKAMMSLPEYTPDKLNREQLQNEPAVFNTVFFSNGHISLHTVEDIPESEIAILKRFAKVFEQTYTRFLDLQKAEAQAREAQIETALEKVRSRTMAMRSSDELLEVVSVVYKELATVGVKVHLALILIYDWQTKQMEWWSSGQGIDVLPVKYQIQIRPEFENHPWLVRYFDAQKNKTEFELYTLEGEIKKTADNYLFEKTDMMNMPDEFKRKMRSYERIVLAEAFMKRGVLSISVINELPPEEISLIKRFARVIDAAFNRVEELRLAENQAREAMKQASLDRVRGDIASMRTADDLNRITPVIWRELKALEVPFFRCGIFIINEVEQKVEVYLSTPDGKAIAALNLSVNNNDLTKNTVEHWRQKQILHTHWNREEFLAWTHSMMDLGQVKDEQSYQGTATAPESLDLHFVPFKQGMLYVGNIAPLTAEKLDLVKTLAEAFSIAYARYEDFKNLEEAKNKIELTLSELKAAQKQLIQSEKMASLGELTAGIAHEIQNPLNFVNNFSDLNKELLEELRAEADNGNLEEVKAIASDVIGNEDKINHHGKRAESIVKGMLLHSRGSSGQKEPTDLNALCDEYLRLSYHGFRAKDKSFNAEFKLEADETLPKIEVVPQDIGRVLLNLINNAFYAVGTRHALSPQQYRPLVIVSTKKMEDHVEISVKDNGPGIPDEVKEKIFQPFFTTKPTGSGTGLGLSLSYDIIKTHGGNLEVNSEIGEGTGFSIQLPT